MYLLVRTEKVDGMKFPITNYRNEPENPVAFIGYRFVFKRVIDLDDIEENVDASEEVVCDFLIEKEQLCCEYHGVSIGRNSVFDRVKEEYECDDEKYNTEEGTEIDVKNFEGALLRSITVNNLVVVTNDYQRKQWRLFEMKFVDGRTLPIWIFNDHNGMYDHYYIGSVFARESGFAIVKGDI